MNSTVITGIDCRLFRVPLREAIVTPSTDPHPFRAGDGDPSTADGSEGTGYT